MAFLKLEMEDDRALYLNLDQIRAVYDEPREDSVRIEFDNDHHIYLGRDRAEPVLQRLK